MKGKGPAQSWPPSWPTPVHVRKGCQPPWGVTIKKLTNTHPQLIHIGDNFAKRFRRNKNFLSSTTDGREHSEDFTGEKVKPKHLSTLISEGLGACFITPVSPRSPQINNHHVPSPSGEHGKALPSPGRKNTQMGGDLRCSTSSLPIRSCGHS